MDISRFGVHKPYNWQPQHINQMTAGNPADWPAHSQCLHQAAMYEQSLLSGRFTWLGHVLAVVLGGCRAPYARSRAYSDGLYLVPRRALRP